MPRTRKLRPTWPYQPDRAETLLSAIEGGDALGVALDRSGLTERAVFAWLKHAERVADGPALAALEPYRRFSARFRRAVVARLDRLDGEF